MATLKIGTSYTRLFLMVQSADHISGLTGQNGSLVVALSKAGAAFATAAGTTAEVANGWYKIGLTTADTSTAGDLAYHCTATGGDPTDFADQVQTHILTDYNVDVNGNVSIASNIKQNQALNGFTFVMTSSTTHMAATGLTITAQRSLAGAGFAPCANAVTELSNGVYSINLAATDTNAVTVMLRFTATGADDLDLMLITQP